MTYPPGFDLFSLPPSLQGKNVISKEFGKSFTAPLLQMIIHVFHTGFSHLRYLHTVCAATEKLLQKEEIPEC